MDERTVQSCPYQCDSQVWAIPPHPCGEPALPGESLCILHAHSDWKDRSAREYTKEDKPLRSAFEERIDARLAAPQEVTDLEGASHALADFSGVVFPHDFSHLKGRRIDAAVSFAGAQFRYEASFRNSTFREYAVFEDAVFPGAADFRGARFQAGALFKGATFAMARFDTARLSGANFDHCSFNLDASFSSTRFRKAASFFRTVFAGHATFDNSRFEQNVGFVEATFVEPISFQTVRFGGRAEFPERRHPGLMLDLRRRSEDAASETDPPVPTGFFHQFYLYGAIFADPSSGEEAFRKAKLIHRGFGDYFRAGYCYRMERHYTNKQLPWRTRRFPWIGVGKIFDRILGGWLCGWGEQPWKVMCTSILIIALFGAVLALDSGSLGQDVGHSDPSDRFSSQELWPHRIRIGIYFSAVTFTTLGYGDYYPVGAYGILAASESLMGAALMSLFVVCVARKLMH